MIFSLNLFYQICFWKWQRPIRNKIDQEIKAAALKDSQRNANSKQKSTTKKMPDEFQGEHLT